ncbi:prephenate dehydrogenase/arogenate dehydrogenase family protein [Paralcaligenes sp. KSB-10]|uniref:prephenate dehydrogenase n=1 Tax=Paralcaligenes sp. KSB-10 TaxID=2901142 RepID=UPI001E598C57|nr:prephenate dehydrogenase/arogenate dehydrogenase family protein [Paralcaligenes sp. KSB-10]UHL65182.1 prephenate dehydrogenase/arogenate dehydrogenase family protein [Paralcaligenes sp. KSB-10]
MTTGPQTPASPRVGVLAVIGVGLIGGSFAAALRQRQAVGHILGVGRAAHSLARARQLGLIDEVASIRQAAEQADVIMLAAPVGASGKILAEIEPYLRDDTLITDVGSTKANVVEAARVALGERVGQFVPGHPIAGAEKTGPEAADAALYQGRTVVLTPLAENSAAAKLYLTQLWERCGARVICMEPEAHDVVLASVSHVPHFLSSVFMGQVAAAHDSDVRLGLAGSGFRDFTRIAAGSPEMWRDIFLANRDAVLSELQEVRAALRQAEDALQREDAAALHDFLERAALARRFWGSRSGLS